MKVLIIENHDGAAVAMTRSLTRSLPPLVDVAVSCAHTQGDALRSLAMHDYDAIIYDTALSCSEGLIEFDQIQCAAGGTAVLVFSTSLDSVFVASLYQAGALVVMHTPHMDTVRAMTQAACSRTLAFRPERQEGSRRKSAQFTTSIASIQDYLHSRLAEDTLHAI